MVSKLLSVLVFATSILAHPNHKRHNHFHGTGTGNGWAKPTGAAYPMNGTAYSNGTDFGGSPVDSSSVAAASVTATAVKTLTVQPLPADSSAPSSSDNGWGFSSVSSVAAVVSPTDVAPAAGSSEGACSVLTSTVTSPSVQYVTVTAGSSSAASEVAPAAGAGGAFGGSSSSTSAASWSEGAGGFYGAPSSSSTSSGAAAPTGGFGGSWGSSSSSVPVAAASGGPGEFFSVSSSSTTTSTTTASSFGGLAPSSSSISVGTPTAGEFFGSPGKQTSYPAYGGASSAQSYPTTMATMASAAQSSSAWPSASSAAPSSVPSTSPSTGGSSGGKRGLSYNDASLTDAFAGKGISWAYNWGNAPDGSIVSGAEYVPMLWGQNAVSSWASAAASAIAGGSKHALSFNEPDLAAQSNMDPATAAKLHIEYMNPLAGQVQIGSPAITNGAGTSPLMGIDWLNQFFTECNGQCHMDFVAFHFYDSATNFGYFQSHVQDVITAANSAGISKVWLTEFGVSGSDAQVASFLGQALPFLDSNGSVERYAYFMCGAGDGLLIDGTSISSPIGAAYAA